MNPTGALAVPTARPQSGDVPAYAELPAFADRADAGRRLGEALADRVEGDVIVFAIPRGGVAVAVEAARALEAPLGLALVRKIGAPGNPEVALAEIERRRRLDLGDRRTTPLPIA